VCALLPEAPLEHGCASSAPLERPLVCGRRPHELRRAARERQRSAHDPMAPERRALRLSTVAPQRAVVSVVAAAPARPAPPASPTHGEPAPVRRPARWIARDRVGTRSGCAMRTGCRRSRWRSSSSRCSSRSAAAASGSPAAPLRGSEYLCVRTLRSYLAVSSSEQPIIIRQDKRTDPTEMHNLSPRCCRRRTQDTTAMRCGSAHRTVRFALHWRCVREGEFQPCRLGCDLRDLYTQSKAHPAWDMPAVRSRPHLHNLNIDGTVMRHVEDASTGSPTGRRGTCAAPHGRKPDAGLAESKMRPARLGVSSIPGRGAPAARNAAGPGRPGPLRQHSESSSQSHGVRSRLGPGPAGPPSESGQPPVIVNRQSGGFAAFRRKPASISPAGAGSRPLSGILGWEWPYINNRLKWPTPF
jgi:hypothetical protein